MKWCILLLLLMVYNTRTYPTTEAGIKTGNSKDAAKKVLGSSVVTSVSVILNGAGPQFTDAVGNTIPKPLVPMSVASPINLLNPDRYEFYTFNDNGELVKRLMTLNEIQSIVANGNGDGAVIHSIPVNDRDPEKNVHDIVESVQKVLNKEVAWKKNLTNEHLVLDTPDVSSSWSMILPAVFGNTGTELFSNKPQQVAMKPDTELFTKSSTQTPLIHKAKPHKPLYNEDRPDPDNEADNTNIVNQSVEPSYNNAGLSSPMPTSRPVIVMSSTRQPSSTTSKPTTTTTTTTTTVRTSTTTRKPKPTTPAPTKPTTKRTTVASTTPRPSPSTPYSTTTSPTTFPPLAGSSSYSGSTIPPFIQIAPTTPSGDNKLSQSQIPLEAVDINYGSEPEFSEYNQNDQQTSTGGYGGIEADDLGSDTSNGYNSPSVNAELPTKDDENTQLSFNQILESLTNNQNTEKVELEVNTKEYTTIEPVLYNGDLFPKRPSMPIHTTEKVTLTTSTTVKSTSTAPKDTPENMNTLLYEPLYADAKDPILTELTTVMPTTEDPVTQVVEQTTQLVEQAPEKSDGISSTVHGQTIKVEEKPLSVIETIDQLIADQKNLSAISAEFEASNFNHSVKINSGTNMDDYVHHAATLASNLESFSEHKPTTQSSEVTEITESEEENEINKLIPDVVNQITNAPQIVFQRPDSSEMSNRVSNLAYLNSNLLAGIKPADKLKEPAAVEEIATTTAAPETPVTHTRFNLRPTYQTHTKLSDESSVQTSQTEPNSAIEIDTPHYVKINSIQAEAYLSTEASKEEISTTILPERTTMYSYTGMNDDMQSNEETMQDEEEPISEATTSALETSTELETSHETEQAYMKLGESTEKFDSMQPTTMNTAEATDMPEVTTTSSTTAAAPVKESAPNTLKPVHYYKHPSSATDQKLMQFNNQRPIMRPPALSNLKVTPVGQPPRIPVRLDPIPGQAMGLKSSTIGQDEDVLAFAQLCNELAFNYWKSITNEKISAARSLVISPFALTSMLSMVFLGARGGTSGEMNEILKLDDMVTFNPHLVFKNITDSVEKIRDSHVSAAAFIREIYTDKSNGKVLQFFKEKVQQFYSGHVEEVNFNIVSDIIRRRTNLLAKRHTAGKVPEYLRTNSVWVNGPFATFSANLLQTDCSRGSVFDRDGEMFFQVHPSIRQRRLVPIPAVVWRTGVTAGYDPEVDATVVAFGNALDTVSVVYVMPGQQGLTAAGDSLERLEASLIETEIGTNSWGRLLSSLSERPGLEVQLPRFSHRSFINASAGLQRMGLKSIFNSNEADLRGLTGSASRDVYLSDMIQVNTFTNCGEGRIGDQHHVEMYPAPPLRRKHSGISQSSQEARSDDKLEEVVPVMQDSGRAIYDDLLDPKYLEVPLQLRPRQARIPDSPRLRFDKPFLYFVRHNPTGMILFMGRFNPRLLP